MALRFLEKKLNPAGKLKVVFVHGYGANAEDLFSLWQFVDPENVQICYSIDAPNAAPGIPFGRCWWHIDMMEIQKLAMQGQHRNFSEKTPAGLDRAVQDLEGFLWEKEIVPSECVLVGFSQGSMLATQAVLQSSENYAGLVILSGNLIDKARTLELAQKHKGQKCFQSHGQQDPVLAYQYAEDLYKNLKEAQWDIKFQGFRGGHEIPNSVLQQMREFIKNLK